MELEYFVAADVVAAFLNITRRRVLELVKTKGGLPSHPVPGRGKGSRRTYRFKLSEVNDWLSKRK